MSLPVGIDLGTTNSALAILDDAGRPRIIENQEGGTITPSTVFYDPADTSQVSVGQVARDNEYVHPGHVFQAFKRAMDRPGAFASDGQEPAVAATPIELSALVLKKLITDAAPRVGAIDSVVVTVPANFADEARRATITAGEQAGVTVKHIVNEPTAALFYYSFDRPVAGTVIVYDFGGGTLDVSIAQVNGRNVEIITSRGDPRLGGVDFDKALFSIIGEKYSALTGETLDLGTTHALGKTVEDYKKHLSAREKVSVQVTGGSAGRQILEVSREEFEAATATLFGRAEMLVESVLSDAGLTPSAVADVYLVGGSTRMPVVTRRLTALFGKEPVCHVNPDEVVALGAALYAGINADASTLNAAQASSVQSMQLQEVANHHYGTIVLDLDHPAGPRTRVSVVIEKNTPIPVSQTETLFTAHEGQTAVECVVTQSATRESDPDFVRTIWSGTLGPFPPDRPTEQKVEVTFSYDVNQVMQCSFVDVGTGMRQEVSLGMAESDASSRDLDQFTVS